MCFNLDIIYFLCFESPEAILSTSFSFVLEKAFWSIFGVCVVSFYFLRFSSLKRFRGTSPSFVLEEVFWLMLGTVVALFHSIFFAFATSIRISRVGVPPELELGLARTL